MDPLPYWHVDAFADAAFAGNPASVIICKRWPEDDTMLAIAQETQCGATAFLLRDESSAADWQVRWFSVAKELKLCGHASLASGHVLLSQEGAGESVQLRSREAGTLDIQRSEHGYELAVFAISTDAIEWPEVAAALGGDPREICRNENGYTILAFESEKDVRSLAPDFAALARLDAGQFICTAPGQGSDIASRVFVPGGAINEDAVTGSAHAALIPYWAQRLGRYEFTAHQASARAGNLSCRLDGDRVWIGGQCATVIEGKIHLVG